MDAACRHTRISHDQVRTLAYRIKADPCGQRPSRDQQPRAGEIVLKHLLASDVVAYIRFACVYKRFKDMKELVEAIQSIDPQGSLSLKELEHEENVHAAEEK